MLKLNARDAGAHLNLGIALYNLSVNLLAEKKVDESLAKLTQTEQHLRDAIKINSNGPTAHYYLGLTLIKFKKYDEAQKEIETALPTAATIWRWPKIPGRPVHELQTAQGCGRPPGKISTA